jgi:elongation factor P
MANYPIKRGMLLRHQGHVYEVADFQEHHAGKQKPTIHVALRDVRDGRPVDRSLDALLPIEEVDQVRRQAQYLYAKGAARVFMDSESFEEFEVTDAQLGGRGMFLTEGEEYTVRFIDGAPAFVEIDDLVAMKVAFTSPAEHAVGTAANIMKEAKLENGLEVRVPLFIKTGDLIRIDTRSKAYAGKEKE